MVFAGTKFVAKTLNQVRVHGPLDEKRLYRFARAVNPVDVHGLIPVILRVNCLPIADDAVFRDEPMRFIIGAENEAAAADLRKEVERLRASGELTQIVARMRLE